MGRRGDKLVFEMPGQGDGRDLLDIIGFRNRGSGNENPLFSSCKPHAGKHGWHAQTRMLVRHTGGRGDETAVEEIRNLV
jgi:hypothetical protein